MVNVKPKILVLLVLLFTNSCSFFERKKALKNLPGVYCIDRVSTNPDIFSNINNDTLKMVINNDLSYFFRPQVNLLKKFEGTISLSTDLEISYWEFNFKDGSNQRNRFLGINFSSNKNRFDSFVLFNKCDRIPSGASLP